MKRKRALDDLDHDIRDHIEREIEDNLGRGMTPAEARRAALIAFGNAALVKEDTRAVWVPVWLDQLFQDCRYGLRVLRRKPGFTVLAIMMLALGIGINVTVFTVTSALFKGFPFVSNDRVIYLRSRNINHPQEYYRVSLPDFEDWRRQAKSFEDMAACRDIRPISLSDKSDLLDSYYSVQVTSNTFKVIGQQPLIGRDFAPSDEMPGAAPVAILTYRLWERRYGKDPATVGQTVRINGVPTAVVGVMAEGFSFPLMQDLWVPMVRDQGSERREVRDLMVVAGRLADGVTIRSARAEMATIGNRLASIYPAADRGFVPGVENFAETFHGSKQIMMTQCMLGAVGFVLLIVCANMANLTLARAIGRSRELSLRKALGAGRSRIVRQLLLESVMLSALGGVLGWLIARWGVRTYEIAAFPFGARHAPPWYDFTMDYRVFGYLAAISLGTGLLFGLAPALRLSNLDVNAALKDGGRDVTRGGRGKHLSALLVMGEMALAMVLLAGAGVMIRSFLNIYTADVGVRAANILTAYLPIPDTRYPGAEAQTSFYGRLQIRLEAIPGVDSITIANSLPTSLVLRLPCELASGEENNRRQRATLSALIIGPAYFRTLGATVLTGREFKDADGASGIPIAIVNQRFASTYWPRENPLGKRLRLFDGDTPEAWLTIVGVVSNIVQNDVTRQGTEPLVYLPYRQNPGEYMYVIARTRVPPGSLETAFRREIQDLDSDLPVFSLQTLDEYLAGDYWNNGFYGALFLIFAAIALLLASAGLYAVVAHSVSQRTQEIGIRIAVGATASDILKPVLAQGMLPVGIGLLIGLAGALTVTPILKSVLVQVSPADPIAFTGAAAVLVLAAVLGCLIPARRAMSVDPAVALRHE